MLEVPFPLGGIVDEKPVHHQPEMTTRDALNVISFDANGRARGAQRPGLTALWNVSALLASGSSGSSGS